MSLSLQETISVVAPLKPSSATRISEWGQKLTKPELIELLQVTGNKQQDLFEQARNVRQSDEVVLRGVIEITNYCQKNCNYCAMRAVNTNLERYRLTAEDILSIGKEIKQANASVIFLQGGQDPQYDQVVAEVIPDLKSLGLEVLLCLGERPKETYTRFAQLGADSYILKFETSDPVLYQETAYTSLAKRIQCLEWLREAGYKIGTGNIVGLPGQTMDRLAEDFLLSRELETDFVSASPFIPNQDTPFEGLPSGNFNLTLNLMAIYRLTMPSALIPSVSALEKLQPGGQLQGLNTGANILTINFTPENYRQQYSIYSKKTICCQFRTRPQNH